jgi:hypothetical protein
MSTVDTLTLPKTRDVRVTDALYESDVTALAEHSIAAIRIPDYCSAELSQEFAERLLTHPMFGFYANATNIGRVGMAYFETICNPALRARYYSESRHMMQAIRQACAPLLTPIDRLRLELQEAWPWGANIEHLSEGKMFVGLSRLFAEGSEALPHDDQLWRDAPASPLAHELRTQLTGNVYLQVGEGGDLDLWESQLTPEEFEALRLPGSYGLDRARLPEPDLTLQPEVGELILFNPTYLHAVRRITEGVRITVTFFIGYRGRQQPLTYWS